jgi:hypothetical protein
VVTFTDGANLQPKPLADPNYTTKRKEYVMNLPNIVHSILLLVVAALLRLAFAFLKIEIPEEVFNLIVFGIVTWLVSLIFRPVAERIAFRVRSALGIR